jgi:type VI secretion system protein ImpM
VPDGRGKSTIGLFGKLPAVGDFIGRGLGHAQRAAVDAWLSSGLLELQASSPQWLDTYLVSPVWQWVLPAGRLCEPALAGVLMPSVDRVGRYFPLIAMRALGSDEDPARLGAELAAWAAAMPLALHQALDPDALLARLDEAARTPTGTPESAAAHARLLASFKAGGHLSLWWSQVGPAAPARFISHRGQADAGLFVSLFDGR